MDYTPGAMRNARKDGFQVIDRSPMSQGTRAHQVVAYIVFDSTLVMLCDSPSLYLHEEETTRFICSIPIVFDVTNVLSGRVGEYIVMARRKGEHWYVGEPPKSISHFSAKGCGKPQFSVTVRTVASWVKTMLWSAVK